MSEQPTTPQPPAPDDRRAEYHKTMRAKRMRSEAFIYPCRSSAQSVRFDFPLVLPFERSQVVLGWMQAVEEGDEMTFIAGARAALHAWVGDEGYQRMVVEDGLRGDETVLVLMDAFQNTKPKGVGLVGESGASDAS